MSEADIAVIIPVFNESKNIRLLYSRLVKTIELLTSKYQIIFVDDGSEDNSKDLVLDLTLENSSVYYINLNRNFGHQIAVSAGLKNVKAKCTVVIDADLQDPPEYIKNLYDEFQQGYDIVYAKRRRREGESFLKKITASLYYRLLKRLVKFEIPIDAGDFRIMSKRVVTSLNKMPEQSKYLRGQVAWLGYKQSYILYDRESRHGGESAYTIGKMINLAINGITSFSDKPLTYVSRLGFFISLLSFLTILFAIFSHYVLKETITGWTSLIVSVSFFGGIQLLSIGVIGEYLSRINKNILNRPLYVIDSTNIRINQENQSN